MLTLAVSLVVAEGCLWLFVRLPHPHDGQDRLVTVRMQGAPRNRYLPSYHVPGTIQFETDGKVLPGVSGSSQFTINKYGFRSPRLDAVAKPSGGLRIFCVGGSTTECLYLDDGDAWPERLHSELGIPQLDVVNAGHSGDATRDHLALLTQRVMAFAPDVVLFLVGINDLMMQQAPDHSILRDDARSLSPEATSGWSGWKSGVVELSQLARGVIFLAMSLHRENAADVVQQDVHGAWVARQRAIWRALPWAPSPWECVPTPEFELNLRSLVGVCVAHGAVPVLMTQPTLWGGDDLQCEERLWRHLPGGLRVPHRELAQAMERFNDITRGVSRELKVPLVDLAQSFPKSAELFYDDDHLTVAGAREMARVIAKALRADEQVVSRLAMQAESPGSGK